MKHRCLSDCRWRYFDYDLRKYCCAFFNKPAIRHCRGNKDFILVLRGEGRTERAILRQKWNAIINAVERG